MLKMLELQDWSAILAFLAFLGLLEVFPKNAKNAKIAMDTRYRFMSPLPCPHVQSDSI